MSAVDVFTVTYLGEPDATDVTVEIFDAEAEALAARDVLDATGVRAVVQRHVFDPLGN
jgi:hypothetical protein